MLHTCIPCYLLAIVKIHSSLNIRKFILAYCWGRFVAIINIEVAAILLLIQNVLVFCSRLNFWGYSTVNYFSPMIRYSDAGMRHCGHDAINELKILIREAHKRGIEVTASLGMEHPVLFPRIDFDTMFCFARFSWILSSITQLKGMSKVLFYHSEE